MSDILDRVNLTPRAAEAYLAVASRLAVLLKKIGVQPDAVPDEQAYENDDGGLVVYVDLPSLGRFEATIPASEWVWRDRN